MKAKSKKNTDVHASDLEALDQQFQPIVARAEAAIDLGIVAERSLNDVLGEIYDFGQELIKDEELARKFLEARGEKYNGWAKKNIYQPLVKIAFAGRKQSAGLLSQRSEALDITTREKPATETAKDFLDNHGGFKGVYDKYKNTSAIDTLRKKHGGQIPQAVQPPLFELHRAIKALMDFTLPMMAKLDKDDKAVATRAMLIRNYEDRCRIDMVGVGHAFPCGSADLARAIPGLGQGAFLMSDAQATRFVHAYPQSLGWVAASTATEATFTSPAGVVIRAEELSLVPHRARLRACAQMRNHSAHLTLDATGIASFRNWRKVIDEEYAKRKRNMQYVWSHRDSVQQWGQGGRQPIFGPKAPLLVPPLPVHLDLEANGGMTVGFNRAHMPFGSPTFFLVSQMFGGTSGNLTVLPERQLAVADVQRLCDVIAGLQIGTLATFADTDMDQAALCVDALADDDALRFVLPTVISVAGNYATACDSLLRIAGPAMALPAQPQ
ncbi:hypothetical protein [Methylobacterium sp. NFXW15]|uniref:hypothetical protein n=1 Tax=Methylobacterium sp. NFXW15 TaxID=2819512 RepID=UPI003CF0749D